MICSYTPQPAKIAAVAVFRNHAKGEMQVPITKAYPVVRCRGHALVNQLPADREQVDRKHAVVLLPAKTAAAFGLSPAEWLY
ncbi:hypothetical protein X742_33620 [Mesorhizobium sp. LNHC232B00]|nr:hypothetical protein X742_33620 [Mesorhizobium sp. LNHC232B00]